MLVAPPCALVWQMIATDHILCPLAMSPMMMVMMLANCLEELDDDGMD